MNKRPPKYLLRFFRWFCHPDYVEEIEGDLLQRFEKKPSKWRFAVEVVKLLRPSLVKPLSGVQKLNYYGMFKHNLVIAIRGFKKHKTVFSINLIGLVVSFLSVVFSFLWIHDELQKDRFHPDSEMLFQVYSKFERPEGTNFWKGVSGLLEPEIESHLPEAEIATVSTDVHEYTLSNRNDGFKVKGRFADEDYLKVFNYPLSRGDKNALADPSNMLVTKSLANKMFGSEDVIGQSITWHFWSARKTFRIAGVLEDVTSATSEPFEFILPWTYYHDELIDFKDWGNFYGRVVVKLNPSERKLAESKLNKIFQGHLPNEQVGLFLTNFADQYLHGNFENGVPSGGRIDYVNLAIVVSLFILLIACINFVNLSTAFASLKTKEIGVKKSFGASKRILAFQFLSESVLLTILALAITLLLSTVLLEPFNQLTGKQLSFSFSPAYLGTLLLFVISIGVLAGLYPALMLSGMNVISALKSKITGKSSSRSLGRHTLVFVQFTLSIMLIVGTLLVGEQLDYALNKNLGYDRDNLMYFLREGKLLENDEAFAAELKKIPGVIAVSRSGFSVSPDMQNRTMGLDWEGKSENQQISFWENSGDAGSVEIIGLEIVAGRNFDKQLNSETNSVIFNEKAIEMMGLEDPIGKTVEHYSGKKQIIGIVKDFTTESLHNPTEPAMFFFNPERAHYVMVKIARGAELATVEKLETLYQEFNPGYPFEPGFVDQDYQAMYESEMRVSKLSKLFAGFAILISCMGLFGLTIFQVKRRVKEIGIRKVLGASRLGLAVTMTYSFTKSVFAALLVALPLSYLFGSRWLQNFSDSISLSWWLFALPALIAIFISFITVGTQTLGAANANPVDSLQDE